MPAVVPTNQPPILTNPGSQAGLEGDVVSVQIQYSDPDGDAVTVGASGLPAALSIDTSTGLISGALDYAAAETNGGVYIVTLNASDGRGGTASATFVWTIANTNRAPILVNPGNQTNAEGAAVSLPLQFSDPDGDPVQITAEGLPAQLTTDPVSGLISGTLDFAAAQVNGGVYSVTLTVTDIRGAVTSQTFTWTIADTLRPPIAVDDFAETSGDTPVTIDVLANDYDLDGIPVQLESVSAVSANGGTIAANTDGTVTYTAAANFVGTDTFSYTIGAGGFGGISAQVQVAVAPKNVVFDLDVNNNGRLGDAVDGVANYLPGYEGSQEKLSIASLVTDQPLLRNKNTPAVVSPTEGVVHVILRDNNNDLWRKIYDGEWSSWQQLGIQIPSDPIAVATAVFGVVEIFYRKNDTIYSRAIGGRENSEWALPRLAGSTSLAAIPLGIGLDLRFAVFAIKDNALWWTRGKEDNWTQWSKVPGASPQVLSDVIAVTLRKGSLRPEEYHIFARGENNAIIEKVFDPGKGWTDRPALLAPGGSVGLTASGWTGGNLDLFTRSPDGSLWHMSTRDATDRWSAWEKLDWGAVGNPVAFSPAPGKIDVLAKGPNLTLLHKSFSGTWQNDRETLNFSAYVGQEMRLILDGIGTLSGADEVVFKIETTSQYAGYSGNTTDSSISGAGFMDDYSFSRVGDVREFTIRAGAFQAEGRIEANQTWITIWAKDYGGFAKVTATVKKNGQTLGQPVTLTVPRDQDGDALPDRWEEEILRSWASRYVDPVPTTLSPEEDNEPADPDGGFGPLVAQASTGDHIPVAAEYRGFILDGGPGQRAVPGGDLNLAPGHVRLNPAVKEALLEVDRLALKKLDGLPSGGVEEYLEVMRHVWRDHAGVDMYWIQDNTNLPSPTFAYNADGLQAQYLEAQRGRIGADASTNDSIKRYFTHLVMISNLRTGLFDAEPDAAMWMFSERQIRDGNRDQMGIFFLTALVKERADFWNVPVKDYGGVGLAHEFMHTVIDGSDPRLWNDFEHLKVNVRNRQLMAQKRDRLNLLERTVEVGSETQKLIDLKGNPSLKP
ncbi:MAG: putative Ig domain-containing protein [Gemmataceae bacterium]|nr:putative Ig domain-containing protein [Gemmataceae bacterium]